MTTGCRRFSTRGVCRSTSSAGHPVFDRTSSSETSEPAADGNAGNGNGDTVRSAESRSTLVTDSVPDNDPFLLFPLIVSAGRDKTFDLLVDFLPLPFPHAVDQGTGLQQSAQRLAAGSRISPMIRT